jgi:hypothetical protein
MKRSCFGLLVLGVLVLSALAVHAAGPSIVSLSDSSTFIEGQSLALSVSVNGTGPFTYQWNKAGSPVADATARIYSIAVLATSDAGSYTVTVTDDNGDATTSDAILVDVTPATAPTLSYIPGAVTYTVGNQINLYASAYGTAPLTFVWKHDGETLPATTSSYNKNNATHDDAGIYTVTVSNAAGSITSSDILVTVNDPTAPTFYSSPSGTTINAGGTAYLYANVNSSSAVSLQWYQDGVALVGATGNYYYATEAGSYTVVATNAVGSTTSTAAVVTVLATPAPVAPSGVSISDPVTVEAGGSLYLSSSASGTSPLTYQWRKDGADIPGASSQSYSKSNVTEADAGNYSVVVSNTVGSASAGTSVAVSAARPPVITAHPSSKTINMGGYISLSVGATGTGSLRYQWYKDGTAVAGATSSTYYISGQAQASDAGAYTVVVSNVQGSVTSLAGKVTVLPLAAPVITAQPASTAVWQGQTISLAVGITSSVTVTYQWFQDGIAIPGAVSNYYQQGSAASSDAGSYTVVVTNPAGTVTSNEAAVIVGAATAPVITRDPDSASLQPGQSYYGLSVNYDADSGYPTTVQWYRDGVAIPGATSTNYYISNAQSSDAGAYTATVTNAVGSTTSQAGAITVDLAAARPVITFTSGGMAVAGGGSASLNITLDSTVSASTIVWKHDGTIVPNASATSLNLYPFGPSYAGTYTAEVTVDSTVYTSQPIILSLQDAGKLPRVSHQPTAATIIAGQTASFGINTDGELPITYQWRKDGVDIPGATSSSYYLYDASAANAGAYTVVATNRNGSVTSDTAVLTVNNPSTSPIIGSQPVSIALASGSGNYLSLSIALLNSTGSETFQWYKDGSAIAGATSSSYSRYSNITPEVAGKYAVKVTNSAGSTTSDEAIVSVLSAVTGPQFTMQPANQSAHVGESATFTAVATGASPLSYQWKKNGAAIEGATTANLVLTTIQDDDAATYVLIASNNEGTVASTPATLTINPGAAPAFITQPQSQAVPSGVPVAFTVSVSGYPVPGLQWRKDGIAIANATGTTLSFETMADSLTGNYTVVATNEFGSVQSQTATLTLAPSPYVGTYFGTFGSGGHWALVVHADATATYLAYLPGRDSAIITTLTVNNATGSFVAEGTEVGPQYEPGNVTARTLGSGRDKARNFTLAGTIGSGGAVSGTLDGIGETFSGTQDAASGSANAAAGYYTASALGAANGTTYAIVGPSGQAVVVTTTPTGIDGAMGTVDRGGNLTATTDGRAALALSVNAGQQTVKATLTPEGASTPVTFGGLADTATSTARAVNISARVYCSTGNKVAIGGFVVSGSVAKWVLVRAVGPTLATQGIEESDVLADPTVEIHGPDAQGDDSIVAHNDNWGENANAAEIASTARTIGAGPLAESDTTSAALLVKLTPGSYSFVVRGNAGSSGIALIEVYDAEPASPTAKFINIAARAYATTGTGVTIGGFVIGGNAPKRVLLRAVGPTLTTERIGAEEVLKDPQIALHGFDEQGHDLVIATNDNWGENTNAADIVTTEARVGAMPLANDPDTVVDTTSSALLLNLAPGSYSVVASGTANSSGIVLVEVYDAD